jgi:hypothetical protein
VTTGHRLKGFEGAAKVLLLLMRDGEGFEAAFSVTPGLFQVSLANANIASISNTMLLSIGLPMSQRTKQPIKTSTASSPPMPHERTVS